MKAAPRRAPPKYNFARVDGPKTFSMNDPKKYIPTILVRI